MAERAGPVEGLSPTRRLWRDNRPALYLLCASTFASLLAVACWLTIGWLIARIVARVFIEDQTLSDVTPLLWLMLGAGFVRALLGVAAGVLAVEASLHVKASLRSRLLASLVRLGPLYTRGQRTGELVHTVVQGVETLDGYVRLYLPARWLAVLAPLLVLAVITAVDPVTAPILLFAGPVLVFLLALIGARTRDLTQRREREMAWMSAHFLDILRGLPTLKMFGRSREQIETIEAIGTRYSGMTMDVLRVAFQTSLVLEWGATAATALVAITVSVRLMAGSIPFDQALTVLILTPEFFLPLRQLAVNYHSGSAGAEALSRIYDVLDAPGITLAARSRNSQVIEAARMSVPAIEFEDVSFSYDRGDKPALSCVTLRLEAGSTTALFGPTGSGKSTLVSLLLRFIEPSAGRVTTGGVPLEDIAPDDWRRMIAWVPQHPELLNGTIADNLRLGYEDASEAQVIEAAKTAHIHNFIASLAGGYDTLAGENGARLSGGQLQRLALARALIRDAPVLILDEATSHLDRELEAAVWDSVRAFAAAKTVLIISHRELPLRHADAVIRLDHGRITHVGRGVGAESRLAA